MWGAPPPPRISDKYHKYIPYMEMKTNVLSPVDELTSHLLSNLPLNLSFFTDPNFGAVSKQGIYFLDTIHEKVN